MYERILVPTDGSSTAENAVRHAVDLARRHEATLHAVYVVDVGRPALGGKADQLWEPVVEAVRNHGNRHTAAVVEEAGEAGVSAQQAVVEGARPAKAILDYADEHDVDVVVAGTDGRSGPARWLLGSVAENVVRGSTVPVLLVPPADAS